MVDSRRTALMPTQSFSAFERNLQRKLAEAILRFAGPVWFHCMEFRPPNGLASKRYTTCIRQIAAAYGASDCRGCGTYRYLRNRSANFKMPEFERMIRDGFVNKVESIRGAVAIHSGWKI
jgi:hypothetical protein